MVTGNSAGEAGCDRNNQHLIGISSAKNIAHDGDQNSEGAPAGTGGEGQEYSHKEDNGRQEHFEHACRACYQVMYIELRTQKASHAGQSPSHGQNHNGRNHSAEASRNAFCKFLEGHHVTSHIKRKGKEECYHTAQHQALRGIGTCEGIDEALACEIATGINHADNAADNQNSNGHN